MQGLTGMSRLILTNNPKILSLHPTSTWIEGGPLEVILECRNKVHEGHPLFTHPLIGDMHLIHNPFRTIILGEKRNEINLISIRFVEESLERLRLFYRAPLSRNDLEDYQIVDLDLFQRALEQASGS